MEHYKKNTEIILDYLKCIRSESTVKKYARLYARLEKALKAKSVELYSYEALMECVSTLDETNLAMATEMLDCVYKHPDFPLAYLPRDTKPKKLWCQLSGYYKEKLDIYIAHQMGIYSADYIQKIKTHISCFLFFIQTYGVNQLDKLTLSLLKTFRDSFSVNNRNHHIPINGKVHTFLSFAAEYGWCPQYLSIAYFFTGIDKVVLLSDMSDADKVYIESLRQESLEFPADELFQLIPDFKQCLLGHRYSQTPIYFNVSVLTWLYVFLKSEGLGYHPAIAQVWISYALKPHMVGWKGYRRGLDLFEQYAESGNIDPKIIRNPGSVIMSGLSVGYKDILQEYLDFRKKMRMKESTLCMDRSSIGRFLHYLEECDIYSLDQLTAGTLVSFNLWDTEHTTHEGKNAYNCRIRGFIEYLEEKGTVRMGLHRALPSTILPREYIVETLTDEEDQAIRNLCTQKKEENPLKLRDTAIILLGRFMGLRGCDVSKLKFSDIDWKNKTIKAIQQKTGVEFLLPMPSEVGNALYRYIKNGRPQSDSEYIFIKVCVPYNEMQRSVCLNALERRVPSVKERKGHGFHLTRKTFATSLFQNGTSINSVITALGHTGADHVMKYVSLDEQRMSECPLTLERLGIDMKEVLSI